MDDVTVTSFDWQSGYCHVFAVTLHDLLGYKLSGLQVNYGDCYAKFRYLPRGHVIEHVYAVNPEGEYFDSDGRVYPRGTIHAFKEIGLVARLRRLTRKQVMRMSGNENTDNFYEFDEDAYVRAAEVIYSEPGKYKSHRGPLDDSILRTAARIR